MEVSDKVRALKQRECLFVSRLAPDVIKNDLHRYIMESNVNADVF